jgi:hypothetical protein
MPPSSRQANVDITTRAEFTHLYELLAGTGHFAAGLPSWLPVRADSGYTGNLVHWVPDRVLEHP